LGLELDATILFACNVAKYRRNLHSENPIWGCGNGAGSLPFTLSRFGRTIDWLLHPGAARIAVMVIAATVLIESDFLHASGSWVNLMGTSNIL
jgi:hypothetical protein